LLVELLSPHIAVSVFVTTSCHHLVAFAALSLPVGWCHWWLLLFKNNKYC